MPKPKFRFNHKTKKWDQLYTFTNEMAIITGLRDPSTGMPKVIKTTIGSAVHKMYESMYARN